MMLKLQQGLTTLSCMLFLQGLGYATIAQTSLAQTAPECDRQQEIFAFQLPNYATLHQGGAILNVRVVWRLTPEAIAKNDYPDFIPIKKEIDSYLANYPKNNDYWEIVNKKLVKRLFDKYAQMDSLSIHLEVMPTSNAPYPRSSIVRSTRPQGCSVE